STANSPARPPVVLARTSGQPQLVFDPAPQRPNPTTKPILAAKQIKTSQSLITPVQINNTAYFAAKDGNFYGINTDSLEVVEQLKLAQPVNRLIRDGSRLKAESLPPNAQTVLDFGSSIDALDPENADPSGTAASIAGKPLPQKFSQHLFAEKQVVSLNGKLYRPLTLGGIRILDGNNVSEHTTKVVGMGLWKIALLPQGPMGYDNTSVYALDDNLRPTKRLINLDPDVGRWTSARVNSFLASDGKSLCFLSAYNNKARMMIWSPHGSKKLREVPVTYNETITTEGNRLILLGDGYLFCGGELTWLPSGDAAPLRFAIGAPIPSAAAPARRSAAIITPTAPRKVQNFTPPIVSGDKILVGHAAGNVYVFDTSTFAAPSSGQDGTGRAQSNP
ncbi:MAG TPA: hypothetical protein VGQ99_03765, partial [Tepidisphaeraceae bacterium]|nr:hypothetical protein [Tepidisphaeraceae bacterium]